MRQVKIHKDGLNPEDILSHRTYIGQPDGSVIEYADSDDIRDYIPDGNPIGSPQKWSDLFENAEGEK